MARLKPFSRTVETVVRRGADQKIAAQGVARIHRSLVAEAEARNRAALGAVPPSETFVDGRMGAALESVKLDGGVILTRFEALGEVVDYVYSLILQNSPIKSGDYRRSHRLFADGVEMTEPDPASQAKEWVIISTLPYSRKIELGQGSAPDDGVYEGAATLAKNRFGNLANVRFTFRSVIEGAAQDYSEIALGGRRGGKTASAEKRAAYNRHNENRFPAVSITLR